MTSSYDGCLYNVYRQLQAVGLNVGLRDAASNLESSKSKSLPCFHLIVQVGNFKCFFYLLKSCDGTWKIRTL